MCVRVVNVRGMKAAARAGVCYVGRASARAQWAGSKWCNPFAVGDRPPPDRKPLSRDDALARFREYVDGMRGSLDRWLAELWDECDRGAKPLGCWCTAAVAGDGSPVVCHAQILAEMLRERFCAAGEPAGAEVARKEASQR